MAANQYSSSAGDSALGPIGRKLRSRINRLIKKRRLPAEQYQALTALKCRVWYNQYGGYCLPESSLHRPVARAVMRAEAYEPQTLEFMRSHCGQGDIVHAGTFFGDFLPALGGAAAPGARVWAFEPNPENYRCAEITRLINALDNVSLANAGLGASADTLHMRIRDENGVSLGGKSRVVAEQDYCPDTDQDVPIVTVDEVVGEEREVSIIQLDVEDHEEPALQGALNTIHRCRPILIVELRKGSSLLDSDWFKKEILGLGYAVTDHVHRNVVLRCPAAAAS